MNAIKVFYRTYLESIASMVERSPEYTQRRGVIFAPAREVQMVLKEKFSA
jgi:hypothetical protein